MGSIVRFSRPRPLIRHPRAKIAVEQETREARHSLFILIGSFFITAVVMCAAVVVMVSSTWTDVVVMSAFVLVFALLKILLANALIYAMLRYDAESAKVPQRAGMVQDYRFASIRQPPSKVAGRRSLKLGKLRVAASNVERGPS
jgi:protein-S-isoprenylcysteine O-methyltransferase Ste14